MASLNICTLLPISLLLVSCSAAPKSYNDNELLKVPMECRNVTGLCTVKPDGYDELEQKINRLLPPHLVELFPDRSINLGRQLSEEPDWHNCAYSTTVKDVYLYTKDETTNEVIAQTNRLNQRLEFVECATEVITNVQNSSDEQCFTDLGLQPLKLKSKCVQTYTQVDLYVYLIKEDKIIRKPFAVPTCCSCNLMSGL